MEYNEDIAFFEKALGYFEINKETIRVFKDPSKEKYPDIWIIKNESNDGWDLYLTNEWQSQHKIERHKRLVHEMLHMIGYDHWNHPSYIDGFELLYSTYPDKDSFSWLVYFNVLHNVKRHNKTKSYLLYIFLITLFILFVYTLKLSKV